MRPSSRAAFIAVALTLSFVESFDQESARHQSHQLLRRDVDAARKREEYHVSQLDLGEKKCLDWCGAPGGEEKERECRLYDCMACEVCAATCFDRIFPDPDEIDEKTPKLPKLSEAVKCSEALAALDDFCHASDTAEFAKVTCPKSCGYCGAAGDFFLAQVNELCPEKGYEPVLDKDLCVKAWYNINQEMPLGVDCVSDISVVPQQALGYPEGCYVDTSKTTAAKAKFSAEKTGVEKSPNARRYCMRQGYKLDAVVDKGDWDNLKGACNNNGQDPLFQVEIETLEDCKRHCLMNPGCRGFDYVGKLCKVQPDCTGKLGAGGVGYRKKTQKIGTDAGSMYYALVVDGAGASGEVQLCELEIQDQEMEDRMGKATIRFLRQPHYNIKADVINDRAFYDGTTGAQEVCATWRVRGNNQRLVEIQFPQPVYAVAARAYTTTVKQFSAKAHLEAMKDDGTWEPVLTTDEGKALTIEHDGSDGKLMPVGGNPACGDCMEDAGFNKPEMGNLQTRADKQVGASAGNVTSNKTAGPRGPPGKKAKPKGHAMVFLVVAFLLNALISCALFKKFQGKLKEKKQNREWAAMEKPSSGEPFEQHPDHEEEEQAEQAEQANADGQAPSGPGDDQSEPAAEVVDNERLEEKTL